MGIGQKRRSGMPALLFCLLLIFAPGTFGCGTDAPVPMAADATGDGAHSPDANAAPDTATSQDADESPDSREPVDVLNAEDTREDSQPDSGDDADTAPGPDVIDDVENDVAADAPPPVGRCRQGDDCTSPGESCQAPGAFAGCGICQNYFTTCTQDADCEGDREVTGSTFICVKVEPTDCSCDSSVRICKPACKDDTDCGLAQQCGDNGRCSAQLCSRDPNSTRRACPRQFACTGSVLRQELNEPLNSCERMECSSDADCGIDGTCVLGMCYADFGTCTLPPP